MKLPNARHPVLKVIGLPASQVQRIRKMTAEAFSAALPFLPSAAQDAWVRARAVDLGFFSSYYMDGHAVLPFSSMHLEFFARDREHLDDLFEVLATVEREGLSAAEERRLVNSVRGWKESWAAPRGGAKSTIKTRLETLRDVCYRLEDFIVIYSNKLEQAEGRTWEVLRELDSNAKVRRFFGDLRGKEAWNRGLFITRTGVRVQAAAMGSESRGIADGPNRPTKVLFDDLENSEHTSSPLQRLKAEDWFTKVPLKLGGPNTPTNFTLAGTVLHRESLLARYLENPGWRGRRFKALLSWPKQQELWDQAKALFCNLEDERRIETARAFYKANRAAMDEGAEVLWPDGEPLLQLMEMLWTEGPTAFYSEKQNDPREQGGGMLTPPNDRSFVELGQDQDGRSFIQRPDGRKVYLDTCRVVAWMDPANAKVAKAKAKAGVTDWTAIVVAAVDDFNYGYVLDVYLERESSQKSIKALFELNRRWRFDRFVYEDNGAWALLGDAIEREAAEIAELEGPDYRGFPYWDIPMEGRTTTQEKTSKIAKLEAPIGNQWLLFVKGLSAEYWEQMESFPTGSHDDGPDATFGAWSLCVEGAPGFRRL